MEEYQDPGDWISELVDEQLNRPPYKSGWLGLCPNKCGNQWHGTTVSGCPGSISTEQILDQEKSNTPIQYPFPEWWMK